MFVFIRSFVPDPLAVGDARTCTIAIEPAASSPFRAIDAFDVLFGGEAGTVNWCAPINDLGDIAGLPERFVADSGYQDAIAAASRLFPGHPPVRITSVATERPVAADPGHAPDRSAETGAAEPPPPLALRSTVTAIAVPGKYAEIVMFGIRAQAFLRNAGFPGAFGISPCGVFGTVGWRAGADALADVDRLQSLVRGNPGYGALAHDAAALFEPASGVRQILQLAG